MKAPEFPDDEVDRVAALHRYAALDSPPSTSFDEITRLAALVLDVPIALVSMVDTQTQWFKAKFGLDVDRTGRDISFCGHAILDDGVLVVPDALADERFADNPLVTGPPHIRFYAGAPLRTPEGHRIGTLCVIDPEPREGITDPERKALVALASLVVDEFELRLKTAELEQRDEEVSRYYEVMGASTDYMGLATPEGVVLGLNPAALEMVGLPPDADVRGRSVAEFHSPEATRLILDVGFPQAIETGSWRGEADIRRIDGTVVPVDQIILCHRDDAGEISYFSTVARDISERTEIVRLQQLQAMKDEFVSTASHELRTPITAVVASLGMLADGVIGELPPGAQEVIDIALVNSNRLVRLVDDLLDLSKLTDGAGDLVMVDVATVELVDSAVAAVEPLAVASGVAIVVDDGTDGGSIRVDPERFERALVNLVGNAVKYSTSGGTVTIGVRRTIDATEIEVVDEGIGIDPEVIPRLFDPFWRVDPTANNAVGGTGLGLAITRRIVENHGGRIEVVSGLGEGARFRIVLPDATGSSN